jgi:hypothetical protein
MSIRSQVELESQFHQRTAQVESKAISPEQAFGKMEDWVVQLGQHRALLHPGVKHWFWYDRLHNEWVSAGCGVGEAILLPIGGVAGIKKLPEPGDAAGWCVYRQGEKFFGPVRSAELPDLLKSQAELKDMLVWSPLAASWLSVTPDAGGAPCFHDEAGNQVSIVVGEEAPDIAPAAAEVTMVGSRAASVDIYALTIQLDDQRIKITDKLRLGSEADNELVLADKQAALHHAIIQRQGFVYKITDLDSASGTFVNGKRISAATLLKNGDIVLIGDTSLTISDQP